MQSDTCIILLRLPPNELPPAVQKEAAALSASNPSLSLQGLPRAPPPGTRSSCHVSPCSRGRALRSCSLGPCAAGPGHPSVPPGLHCAPHATPSTSAVESNGLLLSYHGTGPPPRPPPPWHTALPATCSPCSRGRASCPCSWSMPLLGLAIQVFRQGFTARLIYSFHLSVESNGLLLSSPGTAPLSPAEMPSLNVAHGLLATCLQGFTARLIHPFHLSVGEATAASCTYQVRTKDVREARSAARRTLKGHSPLWLAMSDWPVFKIGMMPCPLPTALVEPILCLPACRLQHSIHVS